MNLNPDEYYVDPEDVKLEALVDSVESQGADHPDTVLYNMAYDLVAPRMTTLIKAIAEYRRPEERLVPFFQDHMNASSFFKAVGFDFSPDYISNMFNIANRIIIEESINSKTKELDLKKDPKLISINEEKIVNQELIEIKGDFYFKNSELNIYAYIKKKAMDFSETVDKEIDYVAFVNQGMDSLMKGESRKEKLYTKYWLTQSFIYMKGILRQDEKIHVDDQRSQIKEDIEIARELLTENGGSLKAEEKNNGKQFLKNLDPKYNTGNYFGTLDTYRIKMVPKVLAALRQKNQ